MLKAAPVEHLAAAGMLIMVPIFILSFTIREYFTEGLTMGAVKEDLLSG